MSRTKQTFNPRYKSLIEFTGDLSQLTVKEIKKLLGEGGASRPSHVKSAEKKADLVARAKNTRTQQLKLFKAQEKKPPAKKATQVKKIAEPPVKRKATQAAKIVYVVIMEDEIVGVFDNIELANQAVEEIGDSAIISFKLNKLEEVSPVPTGKKESKVSKKEKKEVRPDLSKLPTELTELRKLWLKGTLTNKQIEKQMNDLYPEAGTYKGKKIYDLVRKYTDYLNQEYSEEELVDLGYHQATDFLMIYDLAKEEDDYGDYDDNISYYTLDSGKFDKAEKSKNLVVLYAK